jgi:hypothetical protein
LRQRDIPIRAPEYTKATPTKITRGGLRRSPRTVVAVVTITGEISATLAKNAVTSASADMFFSYLQTDFQRRAMKDIMPSKILKNRIPTIV